jgi:hypothetical protein
MRQDASDFTFSAPAYEATSPEPMDVSAAATTDRSSTPTSGDTETDGAETTRTGRILRVFEADLAADIKTARGSR